MYECVYNIYIYGHISLSLRPAVAARVPLAAPGGE